MDGVSVDDDLMSVKFTAAKTIAGLMRIRPVLSRIVNHRRDV
jgi:hypothetical protein